MAPRHKEVAACQRHPRPDTIQSTHRSTTETGRHSTNDSSGFTWILGQLQVVVRRPRQRGSVNRPRLLLWSPLPPPAGGIASWTSRLLESHLTQRYEVRVVNTNVGDLGVSRGSRIARLANTLPHWQAELRRFRPDVVHVNTNGFWPGFLKEAVAVALARMHGVRTLLHFRGEGPQLLWAHRLWVPVFRRLLRLPDAVVVQTREASGFAAARGVERTRVLANFVDRRDAPARDWPVSGRPVRLVFVGWLTRAKGIFELAEAVARVPGVTASLVGRWVVEEGGVTSERRFNSELARLGVADRVTVAPEVPLESVWEHYARADVFVLPSWTEGFPNALLEAMMAGLPAVATPVGAIPEAVVDGETGQLVPVCDVDALAAALMRLVAHPERLVRQGAAARARALARYEREAVVDELADLYDELLHTSTRGANAPLATGA